MPLGSIGNELRKAQLGHYAVPCFDTFEMMGTQGMLAAIEEKRSPAIVALYAGTVDRPGAGAFSALIRNAEDVPSTLDPRASADYEWDTYDFTVPLFPHSQSPQAPGLRPVPAPPRSALPCSHDPISSPTSSSRT